MCIKKRNDWISYDFLSRMLAHEEVSNIIISIVENEAAFLGDESLV